MIRVLIADDHALVREGLKRIVAEAPDMTVVGEAADGNQALEGAKRHAATVVVLDVSMPGRGGLDTLKELKRWNPEVRVLVLSMHPEEQFGPRFLREGADGYLTKESAPEQLLTAIRKIHGRGKYLSPALAETLASSLGSDARAPHERLSAREFEVMRRIAAGKTVGQIGEELALSAKTVSTYRTRILEKTGLRNNAEIMHYAVEHGLA
jgi:DNA-binding NarL/FixJ family response regulator